MRRLDADRLVVAQPQAANAHDLIAFVDFERAGDLGVGDGQAAIQNARAGAHADQAHLLGKAGEFTRAGNQRCAAHKGAAAVFAAQQAALLQIAQRMAQGDAAHTEFGA